MPLENIWLYSLLLSIFQRDCPKSEALPCTYLGVQEKRSLFAGNDGIRFCSPVVCFFLDVCELQPYTAHTAAMVPHLIPVWCFEKAPIFPCIFVIEVDQADTTSDNHWDTFFTQCTLQALNVSMYKQKIRKSVLKKKKVRLKKGKLLLGQYFRSV